MYLLLTLKVPRELAETLEEEFYGYNGLSWETEEFEGEVHFKFYFPISLKPEDEKKLDFLEKLSAKFEEVNVQYSLLKRENWEEIWKYHFKPLKIGKKFLILPPWEEAPYEEDLIPVYIDPGQAFGTGHHPTTQLMLENLELFLEEICKIKEEPFILDMGCGSGILAIAGALLCPKAKIYAVDIDELALEATQKNAHLNKVSSQIFIIKELPQDSSLKFHLILSNIGFRELKKLAPFFKEKSFPGETILLLSGILREDLKELEDIYLTLGFRRIKTQFQKEWALLALRSS